MALWEYKVITSGLHGFASPSLLEAHLNSLAKDEWEIVHFQTLPNNPLAFNGLVRRASARDWSPPPEPAFAASSKAYQEAPTPAAKSAAPSGAGKSEEPIAALSEEKNETAPPTREESIRTFRDTERDADPEADEEEDDWNEWEEDADDLPTFFEALKPHLRRNQKGVGMSVAVDFLAKRWDQRESDLLSALKECGFTIPENEEVDPEYFEFEGDLYWVNRNNRGQLFVNTREKPRPAFRVTPAKKLDPSDPAAAELVAERAIEKAEIEKRKSERAERAERQAAAQAATAAAKENQGPAISDQEGQQDAAETKTENNGIPAPLPSGQELLDRIRPLMRRNRRGPGYSGSVGFLARALKQPEADLAAALSALGLNTPENPSDKPIYVEITDGVYWMNKDSRGGIWINGREKRDGGAKTEKDLSEGSTPTDTAAAADKSAETAPGAETSESGVSSPVTSADAANEAVAQNSTDSSANTATTSADAAQADTSSSAEKSEDNSSVPAGASEKSDSGRPSKPGKPKRVSSPRPRTRKAKTDTEGSAPATPEGDSAGSEESK